MKTLRSQININASPEKVWAILTNFQEYPQWNDFIVHIEGELKEGSQLQVKIKPKDQEQHFTPLVVKSHPPQNFEWKGKLPWGAFNGHHCFKIEEIAQEQVRFIHQEHFSGWLSRPILALIGKQTLLGFERMNLALKQRAESS